MSEWISWLGSLSPAGVLCLLAAAFVVGAFVVVWRAPLMDEDDEHADVDRSGWDPRRHQ